MEAYRAAILDIKAKVPAALGEDLLALYLYGSVLRPDFQPGVSDVNLWLCIRPGTDMRRVRQAFFPLWRKYGQLLKRGPAVVTPAECERYSLLFPDHVRSLRNEARLLAGTNLLPKLAPPDSAVRLAQIAAGTMHCSALLALSPGNREQHTKLKRQLLRLATHQAGLAITAETPPLEILVALHNYLATQSARYPTYQIALPAQPKSPPPLLPGLVALIGLEDQLIIVIPQVDRSLLTGTNWRAVANLVLDEFTGVLLATPWQLCLAASVNLAVDLYLRSFELVWGYDVLVGRQPTERHILSSAAVLPVRVLVEQFPAAYLTAEESDLEKLVHDMQNILQNIQLRGEVMARRQRVPAQWPPEALPGRGTPLHQRVAANFSHFRWWSSHLTAGLLRPASQGCQEVSQT